MRSMPRKSFAVTMRSWELMLDQARPLLAELPELAAQYAELERLLEEARRQRYRVKELGAERKLATRLCEEAVVDGIEARARVAGVLIKHFGTKSEQLVAFGLHPRPRTLRRRSRTEQKPAASQSSDALSKP
jgi:hypothetical protein